MILDIFIKSSNKTISVLLFYSDVLAKRCLRIRYPYRLHNNIGHYIFE